jgi:hypothetical protein
MPSEPQEKTFVATHKLKFTIPDRHGPLTPASRVSTSQPVPSNGGTHSSQSKAGSGTTPLDGSTPLDLKGRLKNWRRNMMQPANQSLQAILSLNRSRYQSVMIFIPENEDYPIYNLDAKLGDRDGYNSIEFRCSASSDGVSSFREITLEIGLFHLGNVNSQNQEQCYPTQHFRPGSNSDTSHQILSRGAAVKAN